MKDQTQDPKHNFLQASNEPEQERRAIERRRKKSKGYAYMSIVGWIDRREKKRRDGDDFDF